MIYCCLITCYNENREKLYHLLGNDYYYRSGYLVWLAISTRSIVDTLCLIDIFSFEMNFDQLAEVQLYIFKIFACFYGVLCKTFCGYAICLKLNFQIDNN